MKWFVYMLRCSDNSLYTGYTNDITQRERTHNAGKGAKYTRSRLPVTLVYQECYAEKSDALKREYAIKQMTKAQKEALAANRSDI